MSCFVTHVLITNLWYQEGLLVLTWELRPSETSFRPHSVKIHKGHRFVSYRSFSHEVFIKKIVQNFLLKLGVIPIQNTKKGTTQLKETVHSE